jgi:hypothetical protein
MPTTVWRTSDSLFCGGVVYLVHENREQIHADIRQFREWEAAGELYAVATATTTAKTEESLTS